MRFFLDRRTLLAGSSFLAMAGFPGIGQAWAKTSGVAGPKLTPAPLSSVKLSPSIFADAQAANRDYLASLDPERFLHNFYLSAGLDAPKPGYGGWESNGIAGHSLGHWLSAVSIIVANTGDGELTTSLDHCLAEMARIQRAHGDGYCGGTTVERDGEILDGKIVFEEVRRGEIRSGGFDLNGGWVPLYTWHKIHAGLIDVHRLTNHATALPIMLGIADYLGTILEGLDETQLQRVLDAEHGGLNEAYADTYALTGDPRWLRLARRIYHRAVLDPIVAGEDRLAGLHANTQIPKVLGLARINEVSSDESFANAARFFHDTVFDHHTYVIGGNSDREHFGPPDQRADRLSHATCEACNTYNMLKLNRTLFGWAPDARLVDLYENAQLNHIMAHQRPDDGRFVYFMPLAPGARRIYSEPEDSFWCCVGSGMESHAKHADSIFWGNDNALSVNLYIPSRLDWDVPGLGITMDTPMPFEGRATLTVERAPAADRTIALRIPGWAHDATVELNGRAITPVEQAGYALIRRKWSAGDRIALTLPMRLSVEATPDDPSVVAFKHGPLVLAADLGPTDEEFAGLGPALVKRGSAGDLLSPGADGINYAAKGAMGEHLRLQPFFNAYDRRAAVYFPTFSPDEWASNRDTYLKTLEADRALAERTLDTLFLGEMQPERDHAFAPSRSEVVNWNGRAARRVPPGDSVSFRMLRHKGPAVLQVLVHRADADKRFRIKIDGKAYSDAWPDPVGEREFVMLQYPVPGRNAASTRHVDVEITALEEQALLYEIAMLAAVDP